MSADQNLAKNLSQRRALLHMTLEEYARELDVPKSTLQSILKTGNTTANTLFHISQRLQLPVDALLREDLSDAIFQPLMVLLPFFDFYSHLSPESQQIFRALLLQLLEVLQK